MPNHRHSIHLLALLAAVALAIGAAACSGEESRSLSDGDPDSARPPERGPATVTTIDTEDLPTISPDECQQLKHILDQGPSQALVPGAIDDQQHQQLITELDRAVASVPDQARPAMETFADAYRQVVDQLADIDGQLGNPETNGRDQLTEINKLMSQPDVQRAVAELQTLSSDC